MKNCHGIKKLEQEQPRCGGHPVPRHGAATPAPRHRTPGGVPRRATHSPTVTHRDSRPTEGVLSAGEHCDSPPTLGTNPESASPLVTVGPCGASSRSVRPRAAPSTLS
ncbi:hypothetical protein K1T71_012402 [Dendrolimus kikuchii]|uniref:Uncharacterized protein n=1 Tax=Dendrolimus kikuchii TaxID=765133 RepID=A0ACC1CLF6_9NEOP|nr:hypothetical protein K1T71_012402 [Dendrolimus kikuchii]